MRARPRRLRRVLALWTPVVLWSGLIFGLSSIPDLGTGLGGWDLLLRKLAHATEYAILAALLARALARPLPALLIAVGYAATDELHQNFVPGRHASPLDVAIDTTGALIALFLLRWWRTSSRRARPGEARCR